MWPTASAVDLPYSVQWAAIRNEERMAMRAWTGR